MTKSTVLNAWNSAKDYRVFNSRYSTATARRVASIFFLSGRGSVKFAEALLRYADHMGQADAYSKCNPDMENPWRVCAESVFTKRIEPVLDRFVPIVKVTVNA